MINKIKVAKNFYLSEFQSPDTKTVMIEPELLKKLQDLRDMLKEPITITSGYRTIEHHEAIYKRIYGENYWQYCPRKSYHLSGQAVDILLSKRYPKNLKEWALSAGFRGIILNYEKGYLHLDIRPVSYITQIGDPTEDRTGSGS